MKGRGGGGEMSVWLQSNEVVVGCEGGNPSEKSNGTLPPPLVLRDDVIFSAMVQTEDGKISTASLPVFSCVFKLVQLYVKSARTFKAKYNVLMRDTHSEKSKLELHTQANRHHHVSSKGPS